MVRGSAPGVMCLSFFARCGNSGSESERTLSIYWGRFAEPAAGPTPVRAIPDVGDARDGAAAHLGRIRRVPH
jgi:hypothetical protein